MASMSAPPLIGRDAECARLRAEHLSPRTVDMHVRNILGKLGCRSRLEATSRAHALGLVS
jgi:DNA-binding CsgD family transcriptional regulator